MSGNKSRLQAIYQITNREKVVTERPQGLDKIWAADVFNLAKMEELLSKKVYKNIKNTIHTGGALDETTADAVAAAMKSWAIENGALYYSHIFFPLTNASAEKHDGLIVPDTDGNAITEFTGGSLIKGEPDGSSFPNGSLRMTNAARGHTVWDPTSPVYLMHTDNGTTLCIPSVFISWNGESLDKKVPLLRSNTALNEAGSKVLSLLGETDIAPISSSCGAEQEYFLVDSNFAHNRPDLLLAGRTLFGAPPVKGQQFDDQYFSAIPERVQVYMQDVEERLYRLGIPAKTRHCEVAPGQFELAPCFEAANIASDHQQLLMTLLKSIAKKHGFMCLLHEKPFAGLNGSGKHVNWSVGNATQGNLLDPGKTPHENLKFLLFCGAVIRGVHKYGPLLRAVVASAGNDHRLGANEAPPAIMSVFLGAQLEDVYEQIKAGKLDASKDGGVMDLGLAQIPNFMKDPGDRNRTSPFAFTGNRFEFRAVGSAMSIAGPLISMNAMLADSLNWIAEKLEAELVKGTDKTAAVVVVLKELLNEHGNVIFGGDGYSEEWHKIAVEERGLKNIATAADAFAELKSHSIAGLFTKTNVLSLDELASRFEVYSEQYIMSIEVEANLVVKMAKTIIYPVATRYLSDLADTKVKMDELNVEFGVEPAQKVAAEIAAMMNAVNELKQAIAKDDFSSVEEKMQFCAYDIIKLMEQVRVHADSLEAEVSDDLWPLPTYQEMLFIR